LATAKLRLDRARQRLEDVLHDQLAAPPADAARAAERLQSQHPRERLHRLEARVVRLEQKLKALAGRALPPGGTRYEGLPRASTRSLRSRCLPAGTRSPSTSAVTRFCKRRKVQPERAGARTGCTKASFRTGRRGEVETPGAGC